MQYAHCTDSHSCSVYSYTLHTLHYVCVLYISRESEEFYIFLVGRNKAVELYQSFCDIKLVEEIPFVHVSNMLR